MNLLKRMILKFVYNFGGSLSLHSSENIEYSKVMKLTDFALNEAKKRGRNRCYTFDEKDYALFLRKREIAQELRESIRIGCQGFVAFFQPVFKAENGKLSGAEALMRFLLKSLEWYHQQNLF